MRRVSLILVLLATTGCVNDDRVFTQGRIQDLCNEAIPICGRSAACGLDDREFLKGRFPGGKRVIVRTEFEDQKLIARFLLDDLNFPGTEFVIQAFSPNCDSFDDVQHRNRDLFQLAGDDQILDFELDVSGRGDHLVEIFSDMTADFTMTFTLE